MAKNNHDEEKNIISGDGQIHAFPEEGLSADFVDLDDRNVVTPLDEVGEGAA